MFLSFLINKDSNMMALSVVNTYITYHELIPFRSFWMVKKTTRKKRCLFCAHKHISLITMGSGERKDVDIGGGRRSTEANLRTRGTSPPHTAETTPHYITRYI